MVVDKGWTEGIASKESDEGRERDGVEVGKVSEWEVGWEGNVGKVIDGDEERLDVREGNKGLRSDVEAVDTGEENDSEQQMDQGVRADLWNEDITDWKTKKG